MTLKAGINNLVPGAAIDETTFTPCGYSMNAILHGIVFSFSYYLFDALIEVIYCSTERCLFYSARHTRSCMFICIV